MLSTSYNYYSFAVVQDQADLFKSNLPEIPKLRSIIDNSKVLFSLPSNKVILEVAEGEQAYKITLLTPGVEKIPIGFMVYLPSQRRLDIYTTDNTTIPIIQFKGRKVAFSNVSMLLERAGFSKLFERLSNIL